MVEEKNLADALMELNKLAFKYKFSLEDKLLLIDRCFLLGEACKFLEELGLKDELEKRYLKVLKGFEEEVFKECPV